jgi:rhamnosyltransferase
MHSTQSISVILLTYNAASYLPELLNSLQQQSITFELIIIDSQSIDGTQQILANASIPFITIPKGSFNHGGTRNLALSYAKHEVVVFLTQDALPVNSLTLENLILTLTADKDIAIAYGRQVPHQNATYFGKFARIFNYPDKSVVKTKKSIPELGAKTFFNSNSFSAYKKSLLIKIGGFPEHIIMGEDAYVAAKVILEGHAIAYCADSQVIHSHNYTACEEFKRYFDIGVFHKRENWLLTNFSKVDSEGLKYLKNEMRFLIQNKQFGLFPQFIQRSLYKYIAYRIGFIENILPIKIKRKLSMHAFYWH